MLNKFYMRQRFIMRLADLIAQEYINQGKTPPRFLWARMSLNNASDWLNDIGCELDISVRKTGGGNG